MKMARYSLLLIAMLAVHKAPARAFASGETTNDYAGQWLMKLSQRNFIVLKIRVNKGSVDGTVERPLHYQNVGMNFFGITRDASINRITEASVKDGKLIFRASNPSGKVDERFEMTLKTNAQAELRKLREGRTPDPWTVARVPQGQHPVVAGNWEPNRVYFLDDTETSNPEMKRIFDADQQDRSTDSPDWDKVTVRDAERRAATRKLLAEGQLHTGEDFREAAFVFQHGDKPEDYLLAHTLAMVAAARGDGLALWIAAATLDRYLHSVQKQQIYGTQVFEEAKAWTQDPYDRELISDALRRQLGVPSLSDQQAELKKTRE